MFDKLKTFASDRESRKTQSTFIERFQFYRKKKDRDKCLERLDEWNLRLYGLIQNARGKAIASSDHSPVPDPAKL